MRYNWLVCEPLNYLFSNHETFSNAIKVHAVVLQRIARICSKVRAARAARLFFLIEPIKFLIFDAVVAVGTKAPYLRKQRVRQYVIFLTEKENTLNSFFSNCMSFSENATVALQYCSA